MYFHAVKSTAHPPIIGALGHSNDFIVKQPNTATIKIVFTSMFSSPCETKICYACTLTKGGCKFAWPLAKGGSPISVVGAKS